VHAAIPARTEAAARVAVDGAFQVHKTLGPGLLESAYEHCLAYEITRRGLSVQRQVALPIVYEGEKLDAGYRLHLVIDGAVIVEIKSIDALAPIHDAQVRNGVEPHGPHPEGRAKRDISKDSPVDASFAPLEASFETRLRRSSGRGVGTTA